jgi:hypothetical protein
MTAGNHLSVQRARIKEVLVDVKKAAAVVRADYFLHVESGIGGIFERASSAEEGCETASGGTTVNECVFFLQLSETGDRIVDAVQ